MPIKKAWISSKIETIGGRLPKFHQAFHHQRGLEQRRLRLSTVVDGASSEKALVESINRMSFDSRVRNRSRVIP